MKSITLVLAPIALVTSTAACTNFARADQVQDLRILAVCFWYSLHHKGFRRSRRFSSLRTRYRRLP